MAIHIQDQETDALVRAFAKQRNLGITEAVKVAVREASARQEKRLEDTIRKLEPIWAEIRARRQGGFAEAQQFIDEGWDGL